MSAFACEPGVGSEPAVGWHWASEAARFCDVWVITHSSHRTAIEAWTAQQSMPSLHFEYVDTPAWTSATGLAAMGLRAQYLAWQYRALRRARQLHESIDFDLGHHVTYCSIRYPTFLAHLSLPYVWGPVGGGDIVPAPFVRSWARSDRILERLRSINTRAVRFDPFIRRTATRAAHIVAVTPASLAALPRSVADRTTIAPAIAIDTVPSEVRQRTKSGARFIYVGRLEPIKGVDLAIRALAMTRKSASDISLTVVGDGPSRVELESLAHSLNIADSVTFTGKVPHHDVDTLLANHDAFIFPALRDSGGFAALEAMAQGLPVVCLDLAGPALAVSDSTGIRVVATDPRSAVAGLANAITSLADNRDLRLEMGRQARHRVRTRFAWESKGELMRAIYSDILDTRRVG